MTDQRPVEVGGVSLSESLQIQVDQLARDLALEINRSRGVERERLYERAIDVLREQVEFREEGEDEVVEDSTVRAVEQTANPFAIGIPLFLVGAVMVILFPPVGLLLFAAAAAMAVWGVASVAFGPRGGGKRP